MLKALRVWIGGLFLVAGMAFAISSPIPELEKVSNHLIQTLKARQLHLHKDHGAIRALVREDLLPHVDMRRLSMLVLARHWKETTKEQRTAFMRSFSDILVNTYAAALAEYTSEEMHFLPLHKKYKGKTRVQVDSRIIREGAPPIPVSYRMHFDGKAWKVYDLIVEHVSLARNYRSQFDGIWQQGGMEGLLKTMEKHLTVRRAGS